MENLDFLIDVTISKVYEGKSGENKYGKWTAYNFYVDGDDRKFSYFKTEKSPLLPTTGMYLKMLRFETVEKDGYTNHNVKELFLHKAEKPTQKPPDATGSTFSPKRGDDIGPMTMWGKYIGEVISALIGNGLIGKDLDDAAKDAMETFADCCIVFERQYSNVIELPEPESVEIDAFDAPIEPTDEIPIGDPPPDWV